MAAPDAPESAIAPAPVPVVHNADAHRFEMIFPEGMAQLQYRHDAAGDLVLVHTEVPPALRGRGLADRLAAAALDYARAHHLAIVPVCPFVQKYLTRHPEDQSLVRRDGPGSRS